MPVTTQAPRRLRYVLAAAAAALALGWWWSRSSDEPTSPDAAGPTERGRAGGGRLASALDRMIDGHRRSGPRGLPGPRARGDLAHVTGKVVDHTAEKPVANVEVVFAGPDGEASATTGPDGMYAIDVAPAAYRAYVRGEGVISVGFAGPERLPGPPVASRAGAPDDTLAPTIAIARDQDHVDLEVEEAGIVNGRVFDRAGHPVVGAIVRARGNERPVLGTDVAETGLDGTFRLELPVGGWSLEATHADYAGIAPGEGEPWVSVSPTQVASIDLTMVAGCIVRGHVIAADGGPASDGAVEVGQGDNGFAPAGQIDADGEFRWSTLETGQVLLRAWPWKSPPSVAQTFACSEGARFDAEFRLSTANPDLDGSIATADGRPAPGAFIDVWAMSPGGMSQQERADADGNWAVYALPAGDYLVTATVDGAGQVQRRITVPAHGVALGLSGTGTVVGTTKGLDEGMVALMFGACSTGDVDVPNMTPAATRLAPVHGGHFRIDGVPACQLDIAARAGSQTEVQSVAVSKDREATVAFDLTPPHEVAIHGHVYRADGKPAVGARINTMRDGDDEIGGVTTGSDGSYQVTTSTGDSIIASVEAEVGGVTVPRDAQNGATLDIHLARDDYEGEIQEPGDEGSAPEIEEHTVEANAGAPDPGGPDPGAIDIN